jgi:hypothetical protein
MASLAELHHGKLGLCSLCWQVPQRAIDVRSGLDAGSVPMLQMPSGPCAAEIGVIMRIWNHLRTMLQRSCCSIVIFPLVLIVSSLKIR